MKKIIFATLLLFLVIGVACAAHNNELFKAPSTLHPVGYNDFVDEKGHNINILEYSDDMFTKWFENDTNYLASKYNATCYTGVDDDNDCYLLEVVEKDGNKYIISSWTPNGAQDTKIIQGNLEEFNKLNNLKPIEI